MKIKDVIVPVALVLGILVMTWFATFPLLVNKESVRNELVNSFYNATGMKLEVQGEVVVKLVPIPHLSIDSMYVLNSPSARSPFFLTIKNVEVWPAFLSLFRGKVTIKKMQVRGVNIELESFGNGRMNWQEISKYWDNGTFQVKQVKLQDDLLDNIYFQVSGTHVNYTSESGTVSELNDVNASWKTNASEKKHVVNLWFDYLGRSFAITSTISAAIPQLLSPESGNIELNLVSDKDTIGYAGRIGYKDGRWLFNGDLKFDTEDAAYWVKLMRGQRLDTDTATYRKLPVSLRTTVVMKDSDKMTFPDIVLSGTTIEGKMQADMMFPNRLTINAAIDRLNLEDITENGFLNMKPEEAQDAARNNYYPEKSDSSVLAISSAVKIKDIAYNGRHIADTSFATDIAGKELTIPQFLATMPGDSHLDFSGIGKFSPTGLALEGQVDLEGKSFTDALSLFKTSGFNLPPEDFKRFHLRTNVSISAQEIRLSEIAARIENISLVGGVLAKIDGRTNIRAALSINGLDLDHIMDLWGVESWKKAILSNSIKLDNSENAISVWLKRLGYDMYISTALENYVFNSKLYAKANMNLAATAGKIEFDSESLAYKASHVSGKVKIDVTGETPKIDVTGNIDNLDATTLFANPPPKEKTADKGRWSADVIDFKWMGFINAVYDIKIGHFKYGLVEADNVAVSGNISDRKLNMDSIKATAFEADVAGKLFIDGGTIPTVKAAANVSSLRIERIAPLLPLFSGISGLFNINAIVETNGINMQSMVSNLEGSMGLSGRDIEMHGFNLPGIIRAVAYVHTVADIINVVRRAFPAGNTVFTDVAGSWNISKGVVQTSRTRVNNEQAEGTMASKFDLVNWATSTNVTFALKSLDPVNVPSITVNLAGSIDNPEVTFDTHALEQYVNNKTSEQMLQKYGAH